MPALANPRWERFAQAIVMGLGETPYSQGRAYQAAGYSAKNAGQSGGSAEAAASRLLKKVKPVLERVKELQALAATSTSVTVQTITNELEQARALAEKTEQPSAMVAASGTKAKLHGLFIEKTEIGKAGDFTASSTLEIADRLLVEAGASSITDDMRQQVIVELDRHNRVLDAIASGQTAQA
jgi:hypothetical protein